MTDAFLEYLLELISESESSWHWTLEEAPWQLRLETLLPLVRNGNNKADCILAAVVAAPVPWTDVISALCKEGTQLQGVPAKAAMIRYYKSEKNNFSLKILST